MDRLNLTDLRRRAVRWAADAGPALLASDPLVPEELHDRAADNWRPLLAIADLVGGDWPSRARSAAIAFALADADEDSIAVLLLGDIRTVFAHVASVVAREKGDRFTPDHVRIPSDALVLRLAQLEDRPWAEWGKVRKPITKVQLARLLAPFDIKPMNLKIDHVVLKGYKLAQFEDTFSRYLKTQISSATPLLPNDDAGFEANRTATGPDEVADRSATSDAEPGQVADETLPPYLSVADQNSQNPSNGAGSSEVADQNGREGIEKGICCRDCMYFDRDGDAGTASSCLKFNEVRDPDARHDCAAFEIPT